MRDSPSPRTFAPPVLLWALVLGGIGFVCGFFGPIALAPEANQGPLLGLFITGPGGLALGLAIGIALRTARVAARRQWQVLAALGALLAVATLLFATPPPERLGRVLDAEIVACEPAAARADAAIAGWEKRIAEVDWAEPRPRWKEGVAASIAREPGVVATLLVHRARDLRELRKPWNAGRIEASDWQAVGAREDYWLPQASASCEAALATPRSVWMPQSAADPAWPPAALPNFLGLETLGPVPDRFAAFADR